jgi:hypothetical protein
MLRLAFIKPARQRWPTAGELPAQWRDPTLFNA